MASATTTIVTTIVTAGATLTVGIVSLLSAYLASKRERRRALYSEALRIAVGWREMVYRVRRRDPQKERELIEQFHELQDQLTYYESWVGAESRSMSRSYRKLVDGIKSRTESLITAAWADPPRNPPGNAQPNDQHPDVSDLAASFLRDVRSHLSPWPWRKIAVWWRNRG